MTDRKEPWYPYKGEYDKSGPAYFDLNGIGWYNKLTSDLPEIREQLKVFLKTEGVQTKQFFNTAVVEGTSWDGVAFIFWGLRNERIINLGRNVFEYFKDIPGLVSLSVSVLQPDTRIKEHSGDTDAIYRIHIPVIIPAQLPDCGLRVAGITKPWADNEIIAFCDAHVHEAWNMTDKERIIIIMDVIKEEFLPQTERICAIVLASMKYQLLSYKYKFIKPLTEWTPQWIKNIVRRTLKLSSAIFK